MIIALIFTVVLGGSATAALVSLAGFGWMICIAAYVAGGMIATIGFVVLQLNTTAPLARTKIRNAPPASHPVSGV